MRIRTRKLLGTFGLIALAAIWPLLALMLFQGRIAALPGAGQIMVIVLIGLIWVIPAGLLIRWMQRPDRTLP
jgi:hypothetical protein